MPRTIPRPATRSRSAGRVTPSVVDDGAPFSLEQELKPFGAWVGKPIWVPPKDENRALAETMLNETRPFTAKDKRWKVVEKKHRDVFSQVREFDLFEPSIRLPKGKFFVTVTEEKNFDKIEDPIPACVQTRLEEFMAGPLKQRGAKVYYFKPLCVEIGDELILTTREDLTAAIAKVQDEVFAEYRKMALYRRPLQAMTGAANAGLALPRAMVRYAVGRKQKAIQAMHARLEFERRKLALKTAKTYSQLRTDGCTFDEMLGLTNPLNRDAVVNQYCTENDMSSAKREQLLRIAAGNLPWFLAMSITFSYFTMFAVSTAAAAPVVVCDPAFVAELPGSGGVVLKIGHFDEVAGVTHVEI